MRNGQMTSMTTTLDVDVAFVGGVPVGSHGDIGSDLTKPLTDYWRLEQSLTPAMRDFTDSQRMQARTLHRN